LPIHSQLEVAGPGEIYLNAGRENEVDVVSNCKEYLPPGTSACAVSMMPYTSLNVLVS
jgi:hypothetical protein